MNSGQRSYNKMNINTDKGDEPMQTQKLCEGVDLRVIDGQKSDQFVF